MTLYHNPETGFLGDFLRGDPGSPWTKVLDMPGAPLSDVCDWWREVDKGDLQSDWHPSLQGYPEVPRTRGLAGSGVNIFPPRYSNFETDILPLMVLKDCTVEKKSPGFNGKYSIRIKATADNAECWLTPKMSEFNIKLTPNLRWIISGYFSSPKESMLFTVLINVVDVYGGSTKNITTVTSTGSAKSTWDRQWGKLDFSDYDGVAAQLGFRLLHAGDILDMDAFMLEELMGDTVQPSAYYCPPTVTDGEQIVSNSLTWSTSATSVSWTRLIKSTLPQTIWLPTIPSARIRGKMVLRGVLEIKRLGNLKKKATLIHTLKRAGVTVREVKVSAMPGQEYLQNVMEHVDNSGDLGAIPYEFQFNCPEENVEWRGTGTIFETKR